jgi:hypothetical protein
MRCPTGVGQRLRHRNFSGLSWQSPTVAKVTTATACAAVALSPARLLNESATSKATKPTAAHTPR